MDLNQDILQTTVCKKINREKYHHDNPWSIPPVWSIVCYVQTLEPKLRHRVDLQRLQSPESAELTWTWSSSPWMRFSKTKPCRFLWVDFLIFLTIVSIVITYHSNPIFLISYEIRHVLQGSLPSSWGQLWSCPRWIWPTIVQILVLLARNGVYMTLLQLVVHFEQRRNGHI